MARLKKFKFNSTDYLFPVEDVKVGTTSVVTDGVATIDLSGKQDTLSTQTAYTSKGTSTKVPTITTNTLGQVTAISETNIAFPVTSVNGQTGDVTVQSSGGDVVGPSSSTDGYVAVFDGTTGKAIKDSSINSANLVLTYGSQTINGTKIFGNEPVLPAKTTAATNTGTAPATEAQVYLKQDTLVSGTNIKTVNSNSLVGSGDVAINAVPSGGTTGNVLTKTSSGYGWAAPSGGIENVTTGTTSTVTGIWAGSESEYEDLSTKSGTVLYFTF